MGADVEFKPFCWREGQLRSQLVDFAVLAWAVLGLWPPDIGLDRDSHTALTVPHEAGAGMTLPASVQNDILHDICDKMTYLIK